MWEVFDTGAVIIGVVGAWMTFLSWLGGRQTKAILARQAEILQGIHADLVQMEAHALGRHGVIVEKLEGRA